MTFKKTSVIVKLLIGLIALEGMLCQGLNTYKIAFGSCFKHPRFSKDHNPVVFHSITSLKPDTFVWLGDFAYLDNSIFKGGGPNNSTEMQRRFDASYNDPGYTKLRESKTDIIGIWDDHDSGLNDGDKTNPVKEEVRQMFLDALDVPSDSPRRSNPNGMYFSQYLSNKKIKLILLDTRYSSDGNRLKDILFVPDQERSNIGETQAKWLKDEVENSEAEYTIIGAGITMIAEDHFGEKLFPKTKRYITTLRNPKTRIFLISGDVHYAEFMEDPCTKHIQGYPIREFTSSGLSHGLGHHKPLKYIIKHLHLLITPSTYNYQPENDDDDDTLYRYYRNNFGMMEFSFGKKQNQKWVKWSIHNEKGKVKKQTQMYAHELQNDDFKPDQAAFLECQKKRGHFWKRRIKTIIMRTVTLENPILFFLIVFFGIIALSFFTLIYVLCCRKKATGSISESELSPKKKMMKKEIKKSMDEIRGEINAIQMLTKDSNLRDRGKNQ